MGRVLERIKNQLPKRVQRDTPEAYERGGKIRKNFLSVGAYGVGLLSAGQKLKRMESYLKSVPPSQAGSAVGYHLATSLYGAHQNAKMLHSVDDFYTAERTRGVDKKTALKRTTSEGGFIVGRHAGASAVGKLASNAVHAVHNQMIRNGFPLDPTLVALGAKAAGWKAYGSSFNSITKGRTAARRAKKEYTKSRSEGAGKLKSLHKAGKAYFSKKHDYEIL